MRTLLFRHAPQLPGASVKLAVWLTQQHESGVREIVLGSREIADRSGISVNACLASLHRLAEVGLIQVNMSVGRPPRVTLP